MQSRLNSGYRLICQVGRRISAIALLLAFAVSAGAVRADNYSEGMQAFMQGNYELAKMLWLKAAEGKDSKSMFNLGFLHEQKLVEGADYNKAEEWYRMAGKHGYPAADYHLAQLMIARRADTAASEELLHRSAAKGYPPARRQLGQAAPKKEPLAVESSQSQVAPPVSGSTVASKYLSQAWIKAQNGQFWTIQVLAFEDLRKVQQFIDAHGLQSKAAYFSEQTAAGTLYKLIYGTFNSKEQAENARRRLPAALQEHGPWLRSIASVQNALGMR